MKDYLARLADRTTLREESVAPPSAPRPGVADPFAETAPFQAAPPSPPGDVPELRHSPAPSPPPSTRRDPETVSAPAPVASTPEPVVAVPTVIRRLVDRTIERHEVTRVETVRETSTARPLERTVPAPPPPKRSPAATTEGATEQAVEEPERAPYDLEREQRLLLRKADTFMQRLLDRAPRPATPDHDVASPPEPAAPIQRRIEPQTPIRLQPVERARRMPEGRGERPAEPPSLVIGTLTVEVVSPAPAAPAPRQPIVVVRAARAGRTGLSSSRRFGLGQF
jgi:hypothetical protein